MAENNEEHNTLITASIDGVSTAGQNYTSTEGYIELPNSSIVSNISFAPVSGNFVSNNYGNNYRSEIDLVFVGPTVTSGHIRALGLNPENAIVAYSDIEVILQLNAANKWCTGFYMFETRNSAKNTWETAEKYVIDLSTDSLNSVREIQYSSFEIPQPENDQMIVIAYGDGKDMFDGVNGGTGIDSIVVSVACNGLNLVTY